MSANQNHKALWRKKRQCCDANDVKRKARAWLVLLSKHLWKTRLGICTCKTSLLHRPDEYLGFTPSCPPIFCKKLRPCSQGRVHDKMPLKQWNQSWMIPTAVFVGVVALQNKYPLYSKFSRKPGSRPNKGFVDLGKYMAGFLVKSFGGCCGSAVWTGAPCWPSSNCILVQTLCPCQGN